jgi:molybdopterin synthase sulfur carrier subunit
LVAGNCEPSYNSSHGFAIENRYYAMMQSGEAEWYDLAKVTVRFFATVRDITGQKSIEAEAETVRDLLTVLSKMFGQRFAETVVDSKTGGLKRFYSCMVNGRRIELLQGVDTKLTDNDAIALFPPVGGG